MVFIPIILFVLGAVFGSFACCQTWRLRNRDKSKRSHCQKCSYQLTWYDNLPIISWVLLKGKCRKCSHRIGVTELLSEIFLGLTFASSFIFWPFAPSDPSAGLNGLAVAEFAVFLALLIGLTVLFIYDARWGELPIKPLIYCVACAVIWVLLHQAGHIVSNSFSPNNMVELLGALLVLPLLYYFLYKLSNEQWVGSGDWILCIPLALVLGNFWLAFFCLFTSNLLGCLAAIPTLTKKHKTPQHKIHFGPFLILGFLVVFLSQNLIYQLFYFY